jgi:hypothetical protein
MSQRFSKLHKTITKGTTMLDQICKALGPSVALVVNAEGQVLTLGAPREETPAPPASSQREASACTDCGEPMRYHS